jgi:hypothetical protein
MVYNHGVSYSDVLRGLGLPCYSTRLFYVVDRRSLDLLQLQNIIYLYLKVGTYRQRALPYCRLSPRRWYYDRWIIGGLICNYGKDINPRMAVPIIIYSYLLLSYGLFLARFRR